MKRTSAHLAQQRKDAEAGRGGGIRQKEARAAKEAKAAQAELEQSGVAKYLVFWGMAACVFRVGVCL